MIRIFLIAICIVFFKWILIGLTFPSMCAFHKYKRGKSTFWKVFSIPDFIIEKPTKWGWERYVLYQISFIPSNHFRKFLYKCLGAKIGANVVFHFRTEIREPSLLVVGGGTIVGDNALLDARNGLTFGRNVNLSSNVSIYTEQHDHRDPDFRCTSPEKKPVKIGDRVWIGSNVIILPGVTIGEGAVCCAGCVVTKDVEPYAVVAGVPAKKVNDRPRNLQYEFNGKSSRLY